MSGNHMSLIKLYFSINGRIPRYPFWVYFIIPYIVCTAISFKVDPMLGTLDTETGIGLFSSIVFLSFIYPSIAVFVKRFHDRSHSGWWYLLLFIPLINIWILIETGFLRGTAGPNRYGDDPIQNEKEQPDE